MKIDFSKIKWENIFLILIILFLISRNNYELLTYPNYEEQLSKWSDFFTSIYLKLQTLKNIL